MIGVYTRTELRRTFRNPRSFFFSLAFPLVMYLLIAAPARHQQIEGISTPLYFLSGMTAWGSMAAVLSIGARIAGERTAGWNRQLRITPLSARAYLTTKIAAGYVTATVAMVALSIVGFGLGVRLSPVRWLAMIALILVGLLPFARRHRRSSMQLGVGRSSVGVERPVAAVRARGDVDEIAGLDGFESVSHASRGGSGLVSSVLDEVLIAAL
jgi:hypothetical protein